MLRSPLFRRLVAAVALLALLPTIATALWAARVIRESARAEAVDALRTAARVAAGQAREALRAGDGGALDRLAKRLRDEGRGGLRVTFVGKGGRVLGDSDDDPARLEDHSERPEVRAARESGEGIEVRRSDTTAAEMLYVAVRADPADPEAGVVRAAVPAAVLAGRVRAETAAILAVAVPTGLLAVAVAAVILSAFARAVHDLTGSVESVAAGGPPRRTDAELRDDEIGDLARAIKAMADELERRIATIGRERNEIATIVGAIGEGLIAVDAGSRVLLFNGAAQRLFGLRDAPRPGTPLVDVLPHGEIVALARETVERRVEGARRVEVFAAGGGDAMSAAGGPGGPVDAPRSVEARTVEVRTVEARAAPFGEAAGAAPGAVVLLRDVTETDRYERLRRDFVANVSHELRTPVALVKGFLETLEDGAVTDPVAGPRFLGILRRHVLGLERLVADLLTLSALDAGADDRPPEPVALAEAIEAVLGPFEAVFEKRRLAIERRIPAGLPPVIALRDHVERAIRNLVDNAVKYTPEGGRVTIEARLRDDGAALEVAVCDTGPGIPADDLPRVFERFYRVDKSRSREAGGTGLGLAIVKHIAQQAGGTVTAESEVGKGATFRLTFRTSLLRSA